MQDVCALCKSLLFDRWLICQHVSCCSSTGVNTHFVVISKEKGENVEGEWELSFTTPPRLYLLPFFSLISSSRAPEPIMWNLKLRHVKGKFLQRQVSRRSGEKNNKLFSPSSAKLSSYARTLVLFTHSAALAASPTVGSNLHRSEPLASALTV